MGRPKPGRIGECANVGLRRLRGTCAVDGGLVFDLGADPACGARAARFEQSPFHWEVEVVIAQAAIALLHVAHAGIGEGLLELVAEAVVGQPVLCSLYFSFERRDLEQRAGAHCRVAEFVVAVQIGRQTRRSGREVLEARQVLPHQLQLVQRLARQPDALMRGRGLVFQSGGGRWPQALRHVRPLDRLSHVVGQQHCALGRGSGSLICGEDAQRRSHQQTCADGLETPFYDSLPMPASVSAGRLASLTSLRRRAVCVRVANTA